jgi:phosphoglucosamine mutase
MADEDVQKAVSEVDEELKGNGRVLVRALSTELLIRMMAEAETDEICDNVCKKAAILSEINMELNDI